MILSHVWGYNFNPGTNVVDVLVSRLREKIDQDFEPKLLHTVRGVGYVLEPRSRNTHYRRTLGILNRSQKIRRTTMTSRPPDLLASCYCDT